MLLLHGYTSSAPARTRSPLMRVLDTFVDTPREALAAVDVPTLVVAGDADTERGSVEDLAAVFPAGRVRRVPGDHWTALTSAELTEELVGFLSDRCPPRLP